MATIIDPPSGWRYGFPKPLPADCNIMDDCKFREWLIENGYPEDDIELALKYSRYWEDDESS